MQFLLASLCVSPLVGNESSKVQKTTFPHEFFNESYTIYLYTKDIHITVNKNENYF
jgi:hypothetical protein